MSERIFNRWAKSSSFYPCELQVLKQLLTSNSDASKALLLQSVNAPYVCRQIVGQSSYEATIPYVVDAAYLIECDSNKPSPELEIVDSNSGRHLRFSTEVRRGGFLYGLRGTAVDGGAWPKDWDCSLTRIATRPKITDWLHGMPTVSFESNTLGEILRWCGKGQLGLEELTEVEKARVRFAQPATARDVSLCEARLKLRSSMQYREFVTITNGFGITNGRPYDVLGTRDIEYLSDRWIGLTPLYEDGYVAIEIDGGAMSNYCSVCTGVDDVRAIGDLKTYIRSIVDKLYAGEFGDSLRLLP